MKKKIMTALSVAMITVTSMFILAGCGEQAQTEPVKEDTAAVEAESTEDEVQESTEATQGSAISGTITMAGSTSMEKLANAIAETFHEKYPDVTINAEFTGSSAGIESLIGGSVEIGNSSRNLKDSEVAEGAVENVVAIDGIAVVTDGANTVADLTKAQLVDIYKGTIKNWKDVGGSDLPIVVVGREAGSGTRGAFEELLEVEELCAYANELDSTGAVMAKVASTPGAIGYVSLDVLDDTVKAFKLEGVEPTADTIKAGTYFLSRPFVMATKGDVSQQSEAVQALFEYLESDEGKAVIESVGLITP